MFKFLKGVALAALVLATWCSPVQAEPPTPLRTFAGTSTDISTTNSYFVISANGRGPSRVTYLNATTDNTNAVVTFWRPTAAVQMTLATNASQAIVWVDNSGTTFAAGDSVVVRQKTADTYQRLAVSSATTTNLTLSANLSAAVVIGDVIYKMTADGTIPFRDNTTASPINKEVTNSGGAIYAGKTGNPILVETTGTSACQINLISGLFDPF